MIMNSWRKNTQKQYKVYLGKWIQYCKKNKKDVFKRDTATVLEFLQDLFDKQLSYSAINTARSALSSIFDSPPIGDHIMVKRFMKGIFNSKPNLPRYTKIWDVSIVLNYLEKRSPGKCLNLRQLTHKLVTLIALVSGQRSQTIGALSVDQLEISHEHAKFHITELLKHTTSSNKLNNCVILPAYPNNKKLCAVSYLKQYIKRTEPFRKNESKLFLSTQEPHKPVLSSTISRWIRNSLKEAGINTDIYKAHSTRAAATSAAAASNIDIGKILKAASWNNASTFGKFYNKPIEKESTGFGIAVLQRK